MFSAQFSVLSSQSSVPSARSVGQQPVQVLDGLEHFVSRHRLSPGVSPRSEEHGPPGLKVIAHNVLIL